MWRKKKPNEHLERQDAADKIRALQLTYEIELLADQLTKKAAALKKELDDKRR